MSNPNNIRPGPGVTVYVLKSHENHWRKFCVCKSVVDALEAIDDYADKWEGASWWVSNGVLNGPRPHRALIRRSPLTANTSNGDRRD